jgi:organic hydroperoxide reductase OsmC/OhrA
MSGSPDAAARGHAVLTDQPATAGGDGTAMTPVELLVGSLSSCVAFYVGRYLARHGLNRDGLQVTAEFALAADRPARVGQVGMKIRVPGGRPARAPGSDARRGIALHRAQHPPACARHHHRTARAGYGKRCPRKAGPSGPLASTRSRHNSPDGCGPPSLNTVAFKFGVARVGRLDDQAGRIRRDCKLVT